MSNTITLKKSGVSGNAPSSSDLSLGEIALNYADGHLYYKSGASATPAKLNAGNADTTDGFHLNQDVRSTASPSFAGLDINGAADISGNLEVGEYILRSGQGSNYHRFLASRQIFVVGNASSIDLNNGTSTFGATGGATTLQGSSLLLDSAADITIDAGGQDIILSDDGTIFGTLSNSSGFQIRSRVNNADLLFRGVDDGTEFTALTLDMSAGGNATFAGTVTATHFYGDGSNLTNLPSGADNTKLPLAGGTMTGHILLNNAIELRSKDTSSNIKTIARVNSSNQLEYGWSGGGPVKFMGGGSYTERMRIHSNGNIGIGKTSPSHQLEIGLTSSVALANQPAEPFHVSNNGQSVDGRVFISVKHDVVNTASAVGAGFKMTAAAVTSGTASYDDSLIYLESAGAGNDTIHSAPKAIKFYVDNHATNAGSGTNYGDLGDLALTIGENTNATFAGSVTATSLIKSGGSSSEFLKADGSVDSSTYLTTGSASSTYLPLAGGTIDGSLIIDTNTGSQPFHITRSGATDQSLKIYVDDQNAIFESIQDETADNYGGFIFNMDAGTTHPFFDIRKNNSTIMRVDGSGNVGIGTTNPTYKLETAGSGYYGGLLRTQNTGDSSEVTLVPTGGSPYIQFLRGSSADWKIKSTGNGSQQTLDTSIDGTSVMTVQANGNVGIGTTSPSTILDVSGTGVGAAGINLSQGEASTISNRLFFSNATANQGIAMYNLGGKLVFGTGATAGSSSGDARMYLTNTGNVGLGTSSPSSMLHLEAAVSPTLQIKDTTNNVTFKAYAQDSNSHLGNTSNHDLFIDTNNASRITVKADGNVGIGTTSPTSKLHISEDGGQVRIGSPTTSWGGVGFAGSLTAANAALWGTATKTNIGAVGSGSIEMKLGNDAGGNGSLKMEADKLYYTGGNLGIGTTSPDHELHVKGDITIDNESSSEPSMLHFNASNKSNFDPTARINFWEGDAHAGAYTGSHAYIEYNGSTAGGGDGYLAIGGSTDSAANSDIMVINRLGRVGIGVASPATQLHVNGEVRVDANDGVAVRKIRSNYFSSGQNLDLVCGASASLILGDGTARLTLASDDTATFAGDVVVSGGLTINGTTTTINSTTLQVDDKNIELGTVATPTDTTADGGGITLKGATDKTINWVNSTDAWTFSERISITPNGSASLPALTFGGDNDTGIYRFASGSDVYIGFSTAGTGRGHFGPAGITSNLNLYSASGGEFRNYGGTWKATTGTTNKGFQFINSVDGTALTISSTGDTVASGSVTATSLVKSGGSSSEFLKADGSVDSSAYLTSNQTITLGGDVSGSGTTSISVSLAADSVGTSEIAANAVGSSEIADNAVTAAAIAANAVGTSEIASSAVGAAQIAANAVRASELSVSGNGSTSQFLRSDGDGTFTWATPVDTNTVYTHPTHAGDDINIDTGALTGATVISDLDFNVTTDGLGHVTDANGTVSTRTLTAANLGISAPNAPASASVAIVGETVEVTFAASTTSNIDAYLVYSSIDGSDYGLISVVPPDDFAASMSIIDNAFDETGTQAYRVYAMKYGILSSAATASVSYAVSSAEPTSLSVVNLNNAYYVQWNPPSSNARFVTAYNVYKHEHATQASLSRSSASLVYSGMNTNYMYQISGTNNNNFHQFWVETTIA